MDMSWFESFQTETFAAVQIQLFHEGLMYYRNMLPLI